MGDFGVLGFCELKAFMGGFGKFVSGFRGQCCKKPIRDGMRKSGIVLEWGPLGFRV